MAKVFGQSADLSGKVGHLTYVQTKYGTVVYPSRRKARVPRRSEKQMLVRMQWANLGAVYRQYHHTLKKAYEDVSGSTMSVFNAFIQANMGVVEVYVPKQVRLNGGSVLAPYQISRGTLDSIFYQKNANNVLVTDLDLGSLVIGPTTTVAQFAAAVLSRNSSSWEKDDQLTFFYGVQQVDAVSHVPRAKISGAKVRLDLTDQTPLWDIVGELGFSSVGGKLAMSRAVTDGSAAWIHSREDESGSLKVSTQYMYVDSTVLASYQGDAAFETSVESYGGINTRAVYLHPDEKTNLGGELGGNVEPSGNGNDVEPSGTGGTGTNDQPGGGGDDDGTGEND